MTAGRSKRDPEQLARACAKTSGVTGIVTTMTSVDIAARVRRCLRRRPPVLGKGRCPIGIERAPGARPKVVERSALLIDLDSLAVTKRETPDTLRRVVDLAVGCERKYAAGVARLAANAATSADALGIRLLSVHPTAQAADIALLAIAEVLADDGFAHLVICTHDADFRKVPLPYTLIVTGGIPAGRKLVGGAVQAIDVPRSPNPVS